MNHKHKKTAASDGATERKAKRSAIMRAVKSRDTKPELMLRTMLRSIRTGYRLHRVDLPGKPDVVYGPRRLAIFMHGCFWHGHDCKRGARAPKENAAYWSGKIARNRAPPTPLIWRRWRRSAGALWSSSNAR
jgi:DNA mismatch endonuclease (patch repair protein)